MAGAGKELQLLGAASGVSPYAIRLQMALAVKGLPYEHVPLEIGQRRTDLLAAYNPVHNKVPVLLHAGRPVCESLVIVEYLDDAFPLPDNASASVLPADPRARAAARFWAAFVDGTLFPALIGMLKRAAPEERAEMVEATLRALGLLEGALVTVSDDEAEGAPFFGGAAVGLVDIALGCYLNWLEAFGRLAGVTPPLLDAVRTPRLAAWADRFRADDAVGALLPGADKVEEYVTAVLCPKWNAAAAAGN